VKAVSGVVLDAGAWIAIESGDLRIRHALALLKRTKTPLVTSAGVLAQIWRGGGGAQVPIALVLARTEVVSLDAPDARTVGLLLGRSGTADPIDAHVVKIAVTRNWPVWTSDPEDLLAIAPELVVERV